MDDLLADFLTEAGESLADLDLALVRLERAPDDGPTLSLIFCHVHTIKGTCGLLGLPRLERVAHAAENVLGRLRDGLLTVTPDVISTVLAGVDRIKEIIGAISATEAEPAGNDEAVIAALNAVADGGGADGPARPPAPAVVMPEPVAPTVAEPAAPQATEPVSPLPAPAETIAPEPHGAQTIRVSVDMLEDLMTLVSKLVLTRNQLLQVGRRQDSTAFAVPLQRLSQITPDLQEGVMKTRMQRNCSPPVAAWLSAV